MTFTTRLLIFTVGLVLGVLLGLATFLEPLPSQDIACHDACSEGTR